MKTKLLKNHNTNSKKRRQAVGSIGVLDHQVMMTATGFVVGTSATETALNRPFDSLKDVLPDRYLVYANRDNLGARTAHK
jgi:hypothetical protein